MRIIDLTLPIQSGMPGIPKMPFYDKYPVVAEAVTLKNQEQEEHVTSLGLSVSPECEMGLRSMNTLISTTSHVGTHVDAPLHFFERGQAVDEIPMDKLVGEAVILDVSPKPPGSFVSANDLEKTGVRPGPGQIAVIKTTWTDRMWGNPAFWPEMPYLDPEVGDWILARQVKAVAMDCFPEKAFWRVELKPEERGINHFKWLGAGVIIIQFLTNLSMIKSPRFKLIALPLKVKGADGAPTRVIGIED